MVNAITPLDSLICDSDKDNQYNTQLNTIVQYLSTKTATASMVSVATGIPQEVIRRGKRELEKVGHLVELRRAKCQITGARAWYLTTNAELFPGKQLDLFGGRV